MIEYPIITKIWRQGNSRVITIPATIVKANQLEEGDDLEIVIRIKEGGEKQ